MWIGVISLFPEMFRAITEHGVTGRAVKAVACCRLSAGTLDFTHDKHRTVDDRPYGGGPGMLMMFSRCVMPFMQPSKRRETGRKSSSLSPGTQADSSGRDRVGDESETDSGRRSIRRYR